MLKPYIKRIFEVANRGDAREESYYSCLEELLKDYADSIEKKQTQITTLPKKTDAGNPDFRVWDGKQSIVGYIEAKQPAEDNLLQIEHTDQLKRYLKTFPNLILTNFFEFRLYREGHLIDKVQIARPYVIHKLGIIPPVEKEQEFYNLLERFFSFSLPKTFTAKTLAVELAKRTRFLKEQVIIEELKEEEKKGKGFILGFYKAFSKYLISGLTKEDFADLYSQTITYGLFAARTRAENGFNRKLAYDRIPRTIGILRDVFKFVSLGDLPQQMEWIIDDISEVLAITDVYKILDEYFHKHKGKDPIVHFYETFLAEYDPKTREKRGVYYTPEPVVSYIVRSIHLILKYYFDKMGGLTDSGVTVLDPAAGTLTFLAEAAKLATEKFISIYGDGAKEQFIKEHILENFYAFELMMAPYAIGHLKMSFLLEELGCKLQSDDRFKLYLTNTLEMEELAQTELPGMASLSEESRLAGEIKKEKPILVILGNPPYSGHSTNVGEWISNEIKAYFQVDGKPLGEKNPKWLQDDYVKFIRFSQWKIEQTGGGVLGFITNHSYLDNPTFRGMRQSLMQSFDNIYLLDLHGNSLKKEKCPDGSKDENVFDIQQGVAIALFIKRLEKKEEPYPIFEPSPQMNIEFEKEEEIQVKPKKHKCKVYHFDVWGDREYKYEWLLSNDVKTTKWKKLKPKSGFYLFIPRDERLLKQYEKYPKVTDIFPVNSVGIVTARDNLTIQWTLNEMWKTVLNFSKLDPELARQAYNLGDDVRDWKVKLAQNDLKESGMDKKKIVPILYRPFDIRFTYYTGKSRGFHCMPRSEVMQHMMKENLGLLSCRQQNTMGFYHVFVSNTIVESCIVSNQTREISYVFPLYIYKEKDNPKKRSFSSVMVLFEKQAEYGVKKPNLSESIIQMLSSAYGTQPTPEEIFFYIYAVLYSNIYRTKYAEFLKIDFPRIPFTTDFQTFKKIGENGDYLVNLHLLKSPDLEPPTVSFHGNGDNRVEKLRYDQEKLYINNGQYFEGITPDLWEYQIGGYKVCDKWLKDRKGKRLSLDDIKHYCKVVTALTKTIEIQKTIDDIYPEAERKTVDRL
jgi:predicted helicase